jgi:uncharacterized membrane protein YfcA
MNLQHLGAFATGILVGFLGGLFGKGGSAVATPLLSLFGFPGYVAVASPLPATIPGTLIASAEYWRYHLLDWEIIGWSIGIGVPATIAGSFLTEVTGARPLLILTGLLVFGFGLSFLIAPEERSTKEGIGENAEHHRRQNTNGGETKGRPSHWRFRLFAVAAGVGLASGLLANSGGFLLAPCYARFLKQPIKKSFACSLAVSTALAFPGTVVHAYLGHISWSIAGLVALGSVPFSYMGARLALRTEAKRLELWYGAALTALGAYFLLRL